MKQIIYLTILILLLLISSCASITNGYYDAAVYVTNANNDLLEISKEKVGKVVINTTYWHFLFIGDPKRNRNEMIKKGTIEAQKRYGGDIELEDIKFFSSWSAWSLILYFDMLGYVENATMSADIYKPKNNNRTNTPQQNYKNES